MGQLRCLKKGTQICADWTWIFTDFDLGELNDCFLSERRFMGFVGFVGLERSNFANGLSNFYPGIIP